MADLAEESEGENESSPDSDDDEDGAPVTSPGSRRGPMRSNVSWSDQQSHYDLAGSSTDDKWPAQSATDSATVSRP